ncbi:NUDIX domain-containing protein [Nocardia sp. IBHARD005]|uniref:NUDIX domain-containing protein n=1 Tax=Nocardia sp. IBHARD005 TaxID=3457765 RepID=UPI00405A03E2
MRGDGDGWYNSPDGVKYWGKFGAAGLLLRAPLPGGGSAVLLQHRAPWSHQGDTWALPGGARDSHESPEHAAVREAEEEAGITADLLRVRAERLTMAAPSGWTYITVIADAESRLPTVANKESAELAWVPEDEVADLPLHPGFATAWIELRAVPLRVRLAADAELAQALPRTVELPDQGFFWLHTRGDGPGIEVVLDGEPAGGPTLTRADVLA